MTDVVFGVSQLAVDSRWAHGRFISSTGDGKVVALPFLGWATETSASRNVRSGEIESESTLVAVFVGGDWYPAPLHEIHSTHALNFERLCMAGCDCPPEDPP